jgi:hypothetical protein
MKCVKSGWVENANFKIKPASEKIFSWFVLFAGTRSNKYLSTNYSTMQLPTE